MFKLPEGFPTVRSSGQDWTDYAELLALRNGSVSFYDLRKIPSLVSDETKVSGINDHSDQLMQKMDDISSEILLREKYSNYRYPFKTENKSYSIVFEPTDTIIDTIYVFLLLSTRLKMSTDRIHENIDGALIFEELSSIVAQNYFGEYAESEVLGTGRNDESSFRGKLNSIVIKIGEGGTIKPNPYIQPKDDGVDIIAWKSFHDKKPSKLIAFGQCKTGTSWIDRLSELDPDSFCKNWLSDSPILTPIKMFFCAQFFPKEQWNHKARSAGLVFDRFRIMNYLPNEINDRLLEKIRIWTNAVKTKYIDL